MAVWHFKFSLVPAKGIVSHHGSAVHMLAKYASSLRTDEPLEDFEAAPLVDYWQEAGISPASVEGMTKLLPPAKSWSPEAKMFGEAEGNRIEVWDDDIWCALDLRTFSEALLVAIVQLAARAECKLVLQGTGEVVEPELPVVMDKILASDAYAFCVAPAKFLREKQQTK